MRFLSTNLSGCGATAAHVLWGPAGVERPMVGGPAHESPSGEGTDHRAVRSLQPIAIPSPRGANGVTPSDPGVASSGETPISSKARAWSGVGS